MKTVAVATFHNFPEAQALKERLEASHLHAEIGDRSRRERLWFVSTPRAAIRVKVNRDEFEKARNLLNAWDAMDGALKSAVRCPECGSSRIEYPQITRKFFMPNLLGILSGMHLLMRRYYCEECHFTWSDDDAKPHRARAHMAPNYFIEGLPAPEDDKRANAR